MEERSARQAALEASLHEVLFQIIKFVNEKKDHIPPIPNLEGVFFLMKSQSQVHLILHLAWTCSRECFRLDIQPTM
ncbi:hypothetical protein Syun_001119 [Stephania yunnanensis]|uniref:Autophagy-related protein 101 n=1 Tax=Stephania yunnanensis TaxID=152371 RepID=A0AAP0LIT1_9MAGN